MDHTTANVADLSALARRLTTEYAVSRILAEAGTAADTLHRVLRVMGRELRWDYCLCWTLVPGSSAAGAAAMRVAADWRHHPERSEALHAEVRRREIRRGEGFVGRVWAQGFPQWIADVAHDPDFLLREQAQQAGLGAGVCCPISFRGEILGILELMAAGGVVPDPDSLPVLGSLAEQIGQFLDHEAIASTLRASEARLRALFEANIAGVHCSELTGGTVAVNPAFVQMFRFPSAAAAMACPASELYARPEDRQELLASLRQSGRDVNRKLRLRRADGQEIWVLANTVLIPSADGRSEMNESTLIDISETEEIEHRRRQTSKLEGIGRLAGGVAHDFNNLLTVINGYSDLLLNALPESDRHRGSVEKIRQAGQRAESLTRQLLAVSRRQASAPVVMDLEAAVVETEALLGTSLGHRIQLRHYCEPGLGRIRADAGQIGQIVMNLAINARDAMPEGGELVFELGNVEIDGDYTRRHVQARAGRYVRLMISDTGTGIDAETRAHVFEPFFTTKPKGKGTGLGLATVYGLMLQSGGWTELYSEVGHGTIFKLYFPRVEAEGAEAPAPAAAVPRGAGEVIVVADDEGGVRELMAEMLGGSGYTVHCAAGATAALAQVAQLARLDLLITDLILPDQTGVGLAAQVAAEPGPWAGLPVLLTSGYSQHAAVHQGLLPAGPHGFHYLQKPFAQEQLLGAVHACLQQARSAKQGS